MKWFGFAFGVGFVLGFDRFDFLGGCWDEVFWFSTKNMWVVLKDWYILACFVDLVWFSDVAFEFWFTY